MRYFPSFDEFKHAASGHTLVPVYRLLLNDSLTPVSAFRTVGANAEHAFLFESVVGGERHGRYSFVGADPFLIVQAYDRRVVTKRPGEEATEETLTDPLVRIEELLKRYQAPQVDGLPRFSGGAVGYAGYDTVRYVEHLPRAPHDDRGLPDVSFAFYDGMIVFDHVQKTIAVVAQAHVDSSDLKGSYESACRRVDALVERIRTGGTHPPLADVDLRGPVTIDYRSNFTRDGFEAAVRKCKEYIAAGDIFQVVLSQRFRAECRAEPFAVYRALRAVNPSPFMFFVRNGPTTLVGASPEIMTRVEGDLITIRPLAGTRKRGRDAEEDKALAAELIADPKERAEHIMLVDLGRNDVGRVSRFGSVQLADLLTVERYSHVMHISSTVTGRLDPQLSAFDALRACLPAGTLSGAPKIRAMEIIDELEPHRRGPYGGAVGYVDYSGNMDTCIALRTMVIHDGFADVQAGAGIVADSDPASEYQETVNKATGLLRALEIAQSQL